MKRRTFLGRIGAAAGMLVAGAKAIAANPDAPKRKPLRYMPWCVEHNISLKDYIDTRLRYMADIDDDFSLPELRYIPLD